MLIGAGLFTTPAHALPEGLVYCHDDNGTMTPSDLTATPPDQPTAICTEVTQNAKNLLSTFYDESYISDYSYLLGNQDGNGGQPGAFSDNIFPSFTDSNSTNDAQRQAMNGMARYLDYRRLDSTLQGAPYQNITYTATGGSLINRLTALNAQRVFYPYMSAFRFNFALSGEASSNNEASVTFDFETPITTDFITLYIASANQQTPLTTDIIATDVDGNTMQTAYSGPGMPPALPIVDGKLEQPTPDWQRVQDAEVAHIATHLMFPHRVSEQAHVIGVVFPTMSLKTLTLSHSDLNQNSSTSHNLARGFWFIGIMNPMPKGYDMVFPLPEGCVVPTPG